MRIKLNDFEEHTIKTKEVLEPTEFIEFVERMNQLVRMIKRDFVLDNTLNTELSAIEPTQVYAKPKRKYTKNGETIRKTNTRDWCDTKEKVINILKIFYFTENKTDRIKQIEQLTNDKFVIVTKSFHGIKERYNIKPQDVGLKYYPKISALTDDKRKIIINSAKL